MACRSIRRRFNVSVNERLILSYWFAYRVFDEQIDLEPGAPVLEGPFPTYDEAKAQKLSYRGTDLQKTSVFFAASRVDAEKQIEIETWMV